MSLLKLATPPVAFAISSISLICAALSWFALLTSVGTSRDLAPAGIGGRYSLIVWWSNPAGVDRIDCHSRALQFFVGSRLNRHHLPVGIRKSDALNIEGCALQRESAGKPIHILPPRQIDQPLGKDRKVIKGLLRVLSLPLDVRSRRECLRLRLKRSRFSIRPGWPASPRSWILGGSKVPAGGSPFLSRNRATAPAPSAKGTSTLIWLDITDQRNRLIGRQLLHKLLQLPQHHRLVRRCGVELIDQQHIPRGRSVDRLVARADRAVCRCRRAWSLGRGFGRTRPAFFAPYVLRRSQASAPRRLPSAAKSPAFNPVTGTPFLSSTTASTTTSRTSFRSVVAGASVCASEEGGSTYGWL